MRDEYGNQFNNGLPLQANHYKDLSLDEKSRRQLDAEIEAAIAAKKHREEEELKALKAAKSKEEAAAAVKVKEDAVVADDGSDSEESDQPDDDLEEKRIQKTLFDNVQNNKHRKVDEMFAQGVDVDLRDQNGNTALHIACQNGAKKMIKTCLKHGANLNAQNHQGQTPNHYCFAYQYERIAAFLISKGADDLVVNEFGLTCYEGLKPPEPAPNPQ